MRWSLKIAKLAGIDIFIHFTFFILVTWVGFIQWKLNGSIGAAFSGIVFILAIFSCVVLHEIGHALAAKKYGIKTRDIILLPIGGVARLEKMPSQPIQELWVALAGPAVNVVIAALLGIYLWIINSLAPDNQITMSTAAFAERIMGVNIFLVVFNMIPAFPMDGGRVLRALLATRLAYIRATQVSASLGQGIAVLFGIIGLFYNPILLLIAIFVWMGAAQETRIIRAKLAVRRIP
ncbi:MAG: site-2 protease family protein [Desulfobacterales bacterium]